MTQQQITIGRLHQLLTAILSANPANKDMLLEVTDADYYNKSIEINLGSFILVSTSSTEFVMKENDDASIM